MASAAVPATMAFPGLLRPSMADFATASIPASLTGSSAHARATLAPSKGRLMRCTVPGSNRLVIIRTPGLPGAPTPHAKTGDENRRYVNCLTLQGQHRWQPDTRAQSMRRGWGHGNAPDSVFSGAVRGAQFHAGSQTLRHLPTFAD